ncbi:hypothetical protein WMY93_030917 [Mugilogobius chulae]|uniref:Uncharacterized protein n=1 Tax=Mugilogobius chulae TaxID=88201 RepID=A0AAW0MI37_9GOBI
MTSARTNQSAAAGNTADARAFVPRVFAHSAAKTGAKKTREEPRDTIDYFCRLLHTNSNFYNKSRCPALALRAEFSRSFKPAQRREHPSVSAATRGQKTRPLVSAATAERPQSPLRRPVSLTPLSLRRQKLTSPLPPKSPGLQARIPLSPRKRTGDENGCNLGSPPKQSKPSPLSSPRRVTFGENSENSPSSSARRQLIPAASPRKPPTSPALKPSPRRQETPTRSPQKTKLCSTRSRRSYVCLPTGFCTKAETNQGACGEVFIQRWAVNQPLLQAKEAQIQK